MAFTKYQVFLSIVMVFTGSINTLSTRWADYLCSVGSDGIKRSFDHPFVQACFMFLGEVMCLLTFKVLYHYYTTRQVIVEDVEMVRGNQNFNPFIFLPPAMFDMIATSLMYIGLKLTYVSSFQMLRGSVVVFVALLSLSFLRRNIRNIEWFGIFFLIMGSFVVGWSDFSSTDESRDVNSVITGDLLVVMAQIITACQMVYEEKFVVDKDVPPLQAVGWEGTFGFLVLSILLVPFYFIKVGHPFADNPREVLEDFPEAIIQIYHNFWLLLAVLGNFISIAFFNFAGISLTKESSATSRMVMDSVRTFFVWMFSLAVSWQHFHVLQLLGFGILLLGMAIYYELLPAMSYLERLRNRRNPLEEPIISQRADEP